MTFHIGELIEKRRNEKFDLYDRHINPWMRGTLKKLGFERVYVRGEGVYLWDDKGERYLDCDAGSGQYILGRAHPGIRQALHEMLDLKNPGLVKRDTPLLPGLLAEELSKVVPGNPQRALFTNTGHETIEASLKFAKRITGRPRLLYFDGDFHGLSYGAISVTDTPECTKKVGKFGPVVPQCERVQRFNIKALKKALEKGDVAALIAEPIQGSTVEPLGAEFLQEAHDLCKKHGTLLIIDEILVGFGRTGKLFASEHFGIEPDIIAMSKGMGGGGVPIGAVMMRDELHNEIYGNRGEIAHSSTFMENDLAMTAGLATLHYLKEERAVENAAARGEQLFAGMKVLQQKHSMIADVRGMGLFMGIELREPKRLTQKVSGKLLKKKGLLGILLMTELMSKHRVMTVPAREKNTLRVHPPLTMTEEDVDYLIHAIDESLKSAQRFPDGISQMVVSRYLASRRSAAR